MRKFFGICALLLSPCLAFGQISSNARSISGQYIVWSNMLNYLAFTGVSTSTLTMSGGNIALGTNWLSGDGEAEGVFVNATGKVGVGTTNSVGKLTIAATLGVNAITSVLYTTGEELMVIDEASCSVRLLTVTNSPSFQSQITLGRAMGTALLPTATTNNVPLGLIQFAGFDGAARRTGASISVGTIQGITPASAPMYLAFSTCPSGSLVNTERVRIIDSGNVGIGTNLPAERLHVNGNILVDGNFLPGASNQYDLGNSTNPWRHLYVGSNSLYMGTNVISAGNSNLYVNGIRIGAGSENDPIFRAWTNSDFVPMPNNVDMQTRVISNVYYLLSGGMADGISPWIDVFLGKLRDEDGIESLDWNSKILYSAWLSTNDATANGHIVNYLNLTNYVARGTSSWANGATWWTNPPSSLITMTVNSHPGGNTNAVFSSTNGTNIIYTPIKTVADGAGFLYNDGSGNLSFDPAPTPVGMASLYSNNTFSGSNSFLSPVRVGTTNASIATLRVYGTNQDESALESWQGNDVMMDGPINVDKEFTLAEDGSPKWSTQIYRNEGGNFRYLYAWDSKYNVMTYSRSGRVGINKPTNLINYHTASVGTTNLDEMKVDDVTSVYTRGIQRVVRATIDATNSVNDTFSLAYANDAGSVFVTQWTGGLVRTSATNIGDGVSVYWGSLTNHNIGDNWTFVEWPQMPRSSLSVSPSEISEVMIYTNSAIPAVSNSITSSLLDRTFEANNTKIGTLYPVRAGNTNSAIYIGTTIPNQGMYFSVLTAGVGVVMYPEYWAGGRWKLITTNTNYLVDDTTNLTITGYVSWDSSTMSDWTKTNLVVDTYTNKFYWLRIRSTNTVVTAPAVSAISRHGKQRFAVYGSAWDTVPAMSVAADGTVRIGDYDMTPSVIQSIYYRFLAKAVTNMAFAGGVATKVNFGNKVFDRANNQYNTNSMSWTPNTTEACRMHLGLQVQVQATDVVTVWLYENGSALATLFDDVLSRTANMTINSTYVFVPGNATNVYTIYYQNSNGRSMTSNGTNNWWYGGKL